MLPAAKVGTKTYWTRLAKDLTDHVVGNESLEVMNNPDLKLYARPDETPEQFAARCQQAALAEADKKAAPLRTKYETKLRTLQTRLGTAQTKAQQAQSSGMLDGLCGVGARRVPRWAQVGVVDQQRGPPGPVRCQESCGHRQRQGGRGAVARSRTSKAELTAEFQGLHAEWAGKAANVGP